MAACEDKASIDCAREMRGTSSIAKLVIRRSFRAFTSSRRAYGCRKPISTLPGCSAAIRSSESGCTVSSTCDCASTPPAESAQSTPRYAASGNWALAPAPRSSSSRAPLWASFSATSGTKLTRVSGALSRSAPMVTGIQCLFRGSWAEDVEYSHKIAVSYTCHDGHRPRTGRLRFRRRPADRPSRDGARALPTRPADRRRRHAPRVDRLQGGGTALPPGAGRLYLRFAALRALRRGERAHRPAHRAGDQ